MPDIGISFRLITGTCSLRSYREIVISNYCLVYFKVAIDQLLHANYALIYQSMPFQARLRHFTTESKKVKRNSEKKDAAVKLTLSRIPWGSSI